jgi:hypothetical protein
MKKSTLNYAIIVVNRVESERPITIHADQRMHVGAGEFGKDPDRRFKVADIVQAGALFRCHNAPDEFRHFVPKRQEIEK